MDPADESESPREGDGPAGEGPIAAAPVTELPAPEEPVTGAPEAPAPAPRPAPGMAARAPGGVHLVAAFLAAGWIFGALEASLVKAREPRALVLLHAAALASIVALGLGIVAWLVALGARRVPALSRLGPRLRELALGADGAESRTRRLQLLGFGLCALGMLALSVTAAGVVLPQLFALQEQELGKQLALIMVGALLAAFVVVVPIGGSIVGRLISALDRRRRVPLPAWALMLVFVTLPLHAALLPVLVRYGAMLGVIRDVMAGLLLLTLGVQLRLLGALVQGRTARALSGVLALAGVALIVLVAAAPPSRAATLAAAEKSASAALGARVARALTDFDRDGVSGMFGGGDCAGFNAARAPSRAEIAGNGVDEDCNGSDTVVGSGALGEQQRFSDALTAKQVKPYNVVWVIMETVRADHIPAHGYSRPTMPYFGKLAKESLFFTRAYAQATATALSIPSMLSGLDPGVATWKRERGFPQLDSSQPTLAERLKERKYRTGLVVSNYMRQNFTAVHRGFDELMSCEPDEKKVNNRPRRNLISTAKAADFMARVDPDDPFFLVVYYPDQHAPYTRHRDSNSSKFEKGTLGDYDSELAFMDQQLQALVELIRARPTLWNDTIIVVTADHGEEFGEHGGEQHALTCYDEVVHVPLLLRVPGIAGQKIDSRVGLIDIVPSILELVGSREGLGAITGQSLLVPALRPESVDKERPIFCSIASVNDKYGTYFRRAVRTQGFTLTQEVNEGRFSLFDTTRDPGEQTDLSQSGEHRTQLEHLRSLLDASLTGNLNDHTRM